MLTDTCKPTVSLESLIADFLKVPGLLDSCSSKLQVLSQHAQESIGEAKEVRSELTAHGALLQDLRDRQGLLEEASRQQQVLSQEHFERVVIEPLTRQLCSILDLCKPDPTDENAGSYQSPQAIHQQVLELLALYGCEPLESNPGQAFDPATMRPLEWRKTGWLERDRQVAESLQMGFRRGKRILRFESVALYRARIQEAGES